jgi:hypothetical protein
MSNYNPFTVAPLSACDEFDIPAFEVCQDGTGYPQRLTQVCGVIIVPLGATKPSDWETMEGWTGVIDNSDTTGTKARYLVGIGSFLPEKQNVADLADGRLVEVKERNYRLTFSVLNMAAGHVRFGELLENNFKDFDVYLETLGGRLIGGPPGMRPVFADSKRPYGGGGTSTETLDIILDFFFPAIPTDNS